MYIRLSAILCMAWLLLGCSTRPVTVVEEKEFLEMARHMPKELQARNLLDEDQAYRPSFSLAGYKDYGDDLFHRLSPDFLFGDSGHVYLGETFSATLQPASHVKRGKNGFSIDHPTQTLSLKMVAIADWNGDGEEEWIASCFVHPKRGGHDRTYYVLIPIPRSDREKLKGTVAAVWECFGLSCSLYVKDSKAIERAAADPLAAPTEVQDVVPGLQTVTTPPEQSTKQRQEGPEERNL